MTAKLIKLSAASLAQDKDNKMALPIITADQTLLVQAIIVYLYADPGLGKSSMGFTAEKQFLLTLTVVLTVLVNYVEVRLYRFNNGVMLQTRRRT